MACLGSAIATGTIPLARLESIKYHGQTKLKEKFTPERWQDIGDEATFPEITKENTRGGFEIHVEQSSLIAMNDSDMAIGVGRIGGAMREKVEKFPVTSEQVSTEGNSHKKVILEFHGVSDHTGGTPPNPSFFKDGPL